LDVSDDSGNFTNNVFCEARCLNIKDMSQYVARMALPSEFSPAKKLISLGYPWPENLGGQEHRLAGGGGKSNHTCGVMLRTNFTDTSSISRNLKPKQGRI